MKRLLRTFIALCLVSSLVGCSDLVDISNIISEEDTINNTQSNSGELLAKTLIYGDNETIVNKDNGESVTYAQYKTDSQLGYIEYLLSLDGIKAYNNCEIIDYSKVYIHRGSGRTGPVASDYYRLQVMTEDGIIDQLVDKSTIEDLSKGEVPKIAHIYYSNTVVNVPEQFQWLVNDDKLAGIVYAVLE